MAAITYFEIENFKGIEKTRIDIQRRVDCPVVTLIGLNESGKTTLLEALSHFVTGDPIISNIFEDTGVNSEALSLIPIHKKANFTGIIRISAAISIDDDDISKIKDVADRNKVDILIETFPREFNISKEYIFEEGNFTKSKRIWSFNFQSKSKRAAKYRLYTRPDDKESVDIWGEIVKELSSSLPSISYFPTFLVEMPSRIYLSEHPSETSVNRYYRSVLQDVLDSLGEGISLQTHVAERIETYKSLEEANWITSFWAAPVKAQVTSVCQKISNAISKEIIGSWNKIFLRPTSAKSINLEFNIDPSKDGLPYVTFLISDGDSQYELHQRSLGFRWFFSFLLFTRFAESKSRKTIFLFDEPAANLHARAQAELLKSFEKIIEGGNKIIYSTHSHHMIEPRWLVGANIIENDAIDYDSYDDFSNLSSKPTKIGATPYRKFISENPSRTSYFQPVLEKLHYARPAVDPAGPVIVTEGVSDFHFLKNFCSGEFEKAGVSLIPGLGDSSSDPLIAWLLGSGVPFVIMLDDDRSGRSAAKRYREKWFLDDKIVLTLGDIDAEFKGEKLETFLSVDTHNKIREHFGKGKGTASKHDIGSFFAEIDAKGDKQETSKKTSRKAHKLAKALIEKLGTS